jgi:hypothetical protein
MNLLENRAGLGFPPRFIDKIPDLLSKLYMSLTGLGSSHLERNSMKPLVISGGVT